MSLFGLIKKIFSFGRRSAPPPEPGINSLVWLLREPRRVNEETVLILARKVLGDDLVTVAELPKNPDLPGDMFMIVAEPRRGFGVIFAPQPYTTDMENEAAEIPELRRRNLFEQHKAWMAIDLMGGDNSPESWAVVAKLLAEFAGPDCLLIYAPSLGHMEPYSDELIEQLQGQDPLSFLGLSGEPPVVPYEADAEELKQAEDEAKSRWSEFINAFNGKSPDHEDFAVKTAFNTADGDQEHMWVMVEVVEGNTIRGLLGNDPINVPEMEAGCPVEIKQEAISDWAYTDKGELVGGFSMKVLMKGQGASG